MELPDRGYHGFLLPAARIVPTARTAMAGIRAAASDVSQVRKITKRRKNSTEFCAVIK